MQAHAYRTQAVRGKRHDVIQRQRRDAHVLFRFEQPRPVEQFDGLQHIGQQVAMREHRALGHTGGATCVLQQRQPVEPCLALQRRAFRPQPQGLHEALRSRLAAFVSRPLQVIDAGEHDVLQLGVRLHRAYQRQQPIEHQDRLGAGVTELMTGLGGRVLRIGIDDHQPSLERAEHGDGVLQRIGQLQRQPVSGLQPSVMPQVAAESIGTTAQLGVSEVVVATGKCRALRMLRAGLREQVMDVLVAATGEFGSHVALYGSGHRHSPK